MKKVSRNALIMTVVFVTIIAAFFIEKYDVTIKYGYGPVTSSPPIISFMIMEKMSDEKIKNKILEDPLSIYEECKECNMLVMRTPLITAIAYERTELIRYMVERGVSVEKNIIILKAEGPEEYIQFLNDVIDSKQKNESLDPNSSLN
ncbi:MAG TPA: hypothetical protein ENH23_04525 [candidate division Zixibacteria bacterium]|nr:hypothetical protein [candidate division Zixibacteria bacterium]